MKCGKNPASFQLYVTIPSKNVTTPPSDLNIAVEYGKRIVSQVRLLCLRISRPRILSKVFGQPRHMYCGVGLCRHLVYEKR